MPLKEDYTIFTADSSTVIEKRGSESVSGISALRNVFHNDILKVV